MSDDRVQQVIDELDPTPASDVDWPVSRRQTLRALAAAGLLGAGSGSASAESAGGVIADEAVFSNYGSESVSDGWELTIDDDVFALTASEETIGLPDGGVGEEVLLPSGVEASEMIAPDGTVVWEGVEIPDSVVEDWERQSPLDDYEGDVSDFSVIEGDAFEGDNYATAEGFSRIASSNLPNIPSPGNQFACRVRKESESTDIAGLCWATQDFDTESLGYEAYVFEDDFRLRRIDGGDQTTLAETTVSIPANEWLTVLIEWQNGGEITCTLFDANMDEIATVNANDDTYTSGGVGWVANDGDVDFYTSDV